MGTLFRVILTVTSLLIGNVQCQDACEKITKQDLGNTDMLHGSGLISDIIGGMHVSVHVQVMDMNIVCEAQHMMKDKYRYTSVVVSFYCKAADTDRVPECANSSLLQTEQFDLGCGGGQWTRTILTISNEARTQNPTANLTTELETSCILCINPNHLAASNEVNNVTHCSECSNCKTGLQRCFYSESFSEVCCNYFSSNVCVLNCPNSLVSEANFVCATTTSGNTGKHTTDSSIASVPGVTGIHTVVAAASTVHTTEPTSMPHSISCDTICITAVAVVGAVLVGFLIIVFLVAYVCKKRASKKSFAHRMAEHNADSKESTYSALEINLAYKNVKEPNHDQALNFHSSVDEKNEKTNESDTDCAELTDNSAKEKIISTTTAISSQQCPAQAEEDAVTHGDNQNYNQSLVSITLKADQNNRADGGATRSGEAENLIYADLDMSGIIKKPLKSQSTASHVNSKTEDVVYASIAIGKPKDS